MQDHGDNSVQGFLEQVVRCWIVMSMRHEFNKNNNKIVDHQQ